MRGIAVAIAVLACACLGFAQTGSKPSKVAAPKLTLGQPIQFGALALVPIYAQSPLSKDQYTVLADATRFGWVHITEIQGNEEVNFLEVKNTGKLPLMLFAGELLLGGKQDRIVGRDTIVPPGEKVKVPVFCVEHGRWNGSTGLFRGGDTFVPDAVRNAALQSKDQGAVWRNVEASNMAASAAPSTGTIRGALNDPKVKKAVDDLTTKMATKMPAKDTVVGMVCWLNGEIHSADLFANAKLFKGSRDKLLRSYAADLQLSKKQLAKPVDMKACSAFLSEIISAQRELDNKNMHGSVYRLKNGKIQGYESGAAGFGGGGFGGGGRAGGDSSGFGHGTYKPGKGGG
jgi:hypothetical protein